MENQGKGIYVGTTFPAEIDLTGDGEPDVAVVSNQADKEIETAKGLSAYMIGTDGFKVSEDGFIEPADAKGIYTFKTAYFKEYLENYASEGTLKAGLRLIDEELGSIPNEKIRLLTVRNLKSISEGKRDFRF